MWFNPQIKWIENQYLNIDVLHKNGLINVSDIFNVNGEFIQLCDFGVACGDNEQCSKSKVRRKNTKRIQRRTSILC